MTFTHFACAIVLASILYMANASASLRKSESPATFAGMRAARKKNGKTTTSSRRRPTNDGCMIY